MLRAVPVLLLPSILLAQEPLSLADAVERGLRSHQQIEVARAKVSSAQGLVLQGGLKPNPRLFLQSENTRFHGNPAFVYPRDADSFVYGAQVLETGGKRERRIEFFEAGRKRTELEQQLTSYQINYRIRAAYWNAVGALRNQEVLAESLANFDRIVQYQRDRVREGAMAEVDLLRAELERERFDVQLKTAEQETLRTRIQLFAEMGMRDPGPVKLTEPLENFQNLTDPDIKQALEVRPDLKIARQMQAQTAANLTLQRANAKADPELIFGYKRTAGFSTIIAGFQINLAVRNKNQGNIAAATADIHGAERAAQAASIAAEAEISAARQNHLSKLRLAKETFPALLARAQESSKIAQAAYREGGSDLMRLLDAERVRIDTEQLYYRALLEYQLSVVELQAATGTLP